jgi:hypothetical protein
MIRVLYLAGSSSLIGGRQTREKNVSARAWPSHRTKTVAPN